MKRLSWWALLAFCVLAASNHAAAEADAVLSCGEFTSPSRADLGYESSSGAAGGERTPQACTAPARLQRNRLEIVPNQTLEYLLYLPPTVTEDRYRHPLVLYLHDEKARGEHCRKLLESPTLNFLLTEEKPFPFLFLAPQCPAGSNWRQLDDLIPALIAEIRLRLPLDDERLYLMGCGDGGDAVWRLAASKPGIWAAMAMIFGRPDPALAPAIPETPVWFISSPRSTRAPVATINEAKSRLETAGGAARLTLIRKKEARGSQATLINSVFEWLLNHRLATRREAP